MNKTKITIIIIAIYMIIAIPLYLINEQAIDECYPACAEEGFDIVVGAQTIGQEKTRCRCYYSHTKAEKFVVVE